MVGDELKRLMCKADDFERSLASVKELASIYQGELDRIYNDEIPAILHEHGLLAAPLEDGRTVTLEQVCNVSQGDKAALGVWLTDNGYDSVIKTSLEFPKGSDTTEIEDVLARSGMDYTKETFVHPMTLKKVMKDHIQEGGEYPPEEAAKVTIFERSRVKGGKKE